MPIDLNNTLHTLSVATFGNTVLNTIFSGTIATAITIAVIMVLIVMIIYPAKSGTPLSVILKMFSYMFMFSVLIVFIHDGIYKHNIEEKYQDKDSIDLIRGTDATMRDRIYDSENIEITPESRAFSQTTTETVAPTVQPQSKVGGNTRVLGGMPVPEDRRNPYE